MSKEDLSKRPRYVPDSHPERTEENALTASEDRGPPKVNYHMIREAPPLTEEQTDVAMKELNNTDAIIRFPKYDRVYIDPVDYSQRIGLLSFVPAKGATPNKNGVFGFVKLRGNFQTDVEATKKARELVRYVDSYHQIYHSIVGKPFPLASTAILSEEVTEVDLRKDVQKSISENVKQKKKDELHEIQEMQDREKKLLEESKKEEEDPFEQYITLRVKKAQITWTYVETQKKLDEMKDIIIKTRSEIEEMDKEDKTYADKYYDKYLEARTKAGLSNAEHQENFMKFLVEDAKLDF